MARHQRQRLVSNDTDVEAMAESIRNDPNALRLILGSQMRRIERARAHIADFFEYVMREETTKEKLLIAPHQRIALSFVQKHPTCILMMPPGHSKTFMMAATALFLMGEDPTLRGAIISATQGQAEKPLSMVKGYVEDSTELHAVFPRLRPSFKKSDPWTQTQITIDRPMSIRDATLIALGIDGAIDGSRLNFILIDDILNDENTRTKESRDKVYGWLQKSVNTRLDTRTRGGRPARQVITNTAWHPEDVPHRLKGAPAFYPTLRMSAKGHIFVEGRVDPEWAVNDEVAKLVKPATKRVSAYFGKEVLRIVRVDKFGRDLDPEETEVLWPERMSKEEFASIERGATGLLPQQVKQLYEQECRDDDTALCKQEYIDRCLEVANDMGVTTLFPQYQGTGLLTPVCGVDLSTGEGGDYTCFFTFFVNDQGVRVILDIDFGKWDASEILAKFEEKHERFNPVFRVEDNGTQKFIRQMLLEKNKGFPLVPHVTDATKKKDPQFGILSIFNAMRNGAWCLPNDPRTGYIPAAVKTFIDACLYYNPSKHTPDILMACHLGIAQAHEWGLLRRGSSTEGGGGGGGGFGDLLSR